MPCVACGNVITAPAQHDIDDRIDIGNVYHAIAVIVILRAVVNRLNRSSQAHTDWLSISHKSIIGLRIGV